MGGISTSDAVRVHRRLSKPRTKSSSTIHVTPSDRDMELSSPSTSVQQDYFGDHAAVVSSQGECRSRRKSRSKIRAYLYGPNVDIIQTSSDEDEGQAALAVRARLSRTGSSIMQLQSAKTSTTRLSNASSSKLFLPGSQSSDAEESAMVVDQIKERAFHDSLAAQYHVVSPVQEDRHVDSVMAPLRRKSLYTPGLATRDPGDILKKPPQRDSNQLQPDRDFYYDPARPKESPLSQLAALQFGEDGRSTPSNMNYPQLGGLQLGTLRVTNASPISRSCTPDLVSRSPTPDIRNQEEYYTASEGSVAGEISAAVALSGGSPLRFESRGKCSPSDNRGNVTPQKLSPYQVPDSAASMAHDYMAELGNSPFVRSETLCSNRRSNTESAFSGDEQPVIQAPEGPLAKRWRQSIDGAEVRHGDGSQEEAFRKLHGTTSFLSESRRPSASHNVHPRYSFCNDAPMIDSGYGSNASLDANKSSMEDTTVASRRRSFEVAHKTARIVPQISVEGSRLRDVDREVRPSCAPSMTVGPACKARCISGPRAMPQHIPEKGRYSLQMSGPAPQPSSFTVIPQDKTAKHVRLTGSSSPTVMRKLQKARPKSQPPPIRRITVQGNGDISQADIPRVPSAVVKKHADRLLKFPLLDHTFPSLDHTTSDEEVSLNEAYHGAYPLPIRFPSPANALEAAAVDHPKGAITSDNWRKSRSRAASRNRKGAAMPNEGQDFRSRPSSRRRDSIVVQVQDDLWPASDIVRSPSWSEFGGGRKSKEQKRLAKLEKEDEKRLMKEEKDFGKRLERERKDLEKRIKRDQNKQGSSRSGSASRTRGRSGDRTSTEAVATIADFGTVTESLGGNPYDIATVMFSSASTLQNAGNWHPHQISSVISRPKSTIGRDEVTASESARARSRARSQSFGRPMEKTDETTKNASTAVRRPGPETMFVDARPMPALAAVDLKTHELNWTHSQQRSRSLSGAPETNTGPFNDRGGVPGRSMRPQSLFIDAPPVPALPSPQQVRQRETQIGKSRPQSMIIDALPGPVPPALPRSQQAGVAGEEVESDGSPTRRSEMLSRPSKTKTSRLVPELWSKGSIEKKSPRDPHNPFAAEARFDTSSSDETPATKECDIWEVQRQAWKQRRQSAAKSAGEALLRNQVNDIFDDRPVTSSPAEERRGRHPATSSASNANPQDPVRPKSSSQPRPSLLGLPNPLASHPPPREDPHEPTFHVSPRSGYISDPPTSYPNPDTHQASRVHPSSLMLSRAAPEDQSAAVLSRPLPHRASTLTIARKRVGSGSTTPTKAIDRLSGRYDGGLQYGYEPGIGLGGSAGTRGARTGASRKSVDISRGFGLDLSDVPIFVAPTPTS